MARSTRDTRGALLLAFGAALCLGALAPGEARAGGYGDRLVAEGHEHMKAGNFFRASESYRCAVLEEPADGMKKLWFGHSLYSLGNYAYAAYSFRRGVRYLGYPDDLRVELLPLFGTRASYDRALRDVRRYAAYYPSDPHALTVIAYVSFFGGDRPESEAATRKLLSIDGKDPFAAYLMRRIEMEAGGAIAGAPAAPATPPAPQPAARPEAPAGPLVAARPPAPARPPPVAAPTPREAPRPAPPPAIGRGSSGPLAAEPPARAVPPEGIRSDPVTPLSEDEVGAPAIAR
jgi:tetratricopeptide (TPR) repeat protein